MRAAGRRIGIVGGGQLGRMLTQAAFPLGFGVTVLDPTPGCPASQVGAAQIVGRLDDPAALTALAAASDVITWEIEHIDAAALVHLVGDGAEVQPSPGTLGVIQDKLDQKELLRSAGIPVAATRRFPSGGDGSDLFAALGRPVVVKTRRGGYDGRGNHVFDGDLAALTGALGDRGALDPAGLYAEAVVPFDVEVAVIVARSVSGDTAVYPTVRTVHDRGICVVVEAPAGLDPAVDAEAQDVARRTVALLGGAGVFAIEMFVVGNGVLVNEIAPRVHNSGHLTIEANQTSQFEQHVRAVTGLPLGATGMRAPAAVMVNILGRRDGPVPFDGLAGALVDPDVHLHLYGKASRPDRKIGHVTALGTTVDEARDRALRAREALPT